MSMKLIIGLLFFLKAVTCIQGYEYHYLGCYNDNSEERALPYGHKDYIKTSPAHCTAKCGDLGFRYFGLAESFQCWCGNSGYDRYGLSTGCIYPCVGSLSKICGGININSVYEIVYPTTTTTISSAETTSTTTATAGIIITTTTPNAPSTTTAAPMTTTPTTSAKSIAVQDFALSTATKPSTSHSNSDIPKQSTTTRATERPVKTSAASADGSTTTVIANSEDRGVKIGTGLAAVTGCAIIILVVGLVVRRWYIYYLRNTQRRGSHDDPYHPIPNRSEYDHHNGETIATTNTTYEDMARGYSDRSRFESTSDRSIETSDDYEEIELPTISSSQVYVSQCFTVTDESTNNLLSEI